MRLYSFVAAAALASASLAAHADTLTETFNVSGASGNVISSSSFQQFNPSLGSLNSVTLSLSGTAVSENPAFLINVLNPHNRGYTGTFSGGEIGPFNFAFSGTTPSAVTTGQDDIGTGTSYLNLAFTSDVTDVDVNNGTVTYNYTPSVAPIAATPEPSSFALLGTGLLGAFGVARKRFA